jgi:hypothetical protein
MASTIDNTSIIFLGGQVHVAEDSSAATMITIVDSFRRPRKHEGPKICKNETSVFVLEGLEINHASTRLTGTSVVTT